MIPKGRLTEAHITTDRERYYRCPAVIAARNDQKLNERMPFEMLAGRKILIHLEPLPPDVGAYASHCDLTHWPVCIEDSRGAGHQTNAWVCPHMVDLPD